MTQRNKLSKVTWLLDTEDLNLGKQGLGWLLLTSFHSASCWTPVCQDTLKSQHKATV